MSKRDLEAAKVAEGIMQQTPTKQQHNFIIKGLEDAGATTLMAKYVADVLVFYNLCVHQPTKERALHIVQKLL